MANYHPSDNTLLEFSAGNLDWAVSICVSAHLQFCPECRQKLAELNAIGGSLFASSTPEEVSETSFSKLVNRINTCKDTPNQVRTAESNASETKARTLPRVVEKLIPDNKPLKWSFISPGLKAAQLLTGQNKYEVSFHKIKRGSKVAEHDHRGLEITLVLEGSFSDSEGNYVVGDYLVREPGDVHRPMAAQDQDCLCLSVVEAPVKVTGIMGKLINPFLRVNPR